MDLSFSGTTGSTELRLFRLPRWLNDKRTSLPIQETRVHFITGLGRSPRSRKWQPNPVFLPGKFHAQMSLAGYSPWGHKSNTTEHARTAMNCLRLFTEWVLVTQCPTLCHPMDSSVSMVGKNTGIGCRALLQGIFSTQEWKNLGLLHCRQLLTIWATREGVRWWVFNWLYNLITVY